MWRHRFFFFFFFFFLIFFFFFFNILFTCMALLHLPLDPRTRIQIYTSYNFTYMFLHIYTRYHRPPPLPPPPSLAPFPLSLNIILNSINVQAHNRSNHISSPPLPTSSILFCVFQFCYVLLQYLFLCFRNILFH